MSEIEIGIRGKVVPTEDGLWTYWLEVGHKDDWRRIVAPMKWEEEREARLALQEHAKVGVEEARRQAQIRGGSMRVGYDRGKVKVANGQN